MIKKKSLVHKLLSYYRLILFLAVFVFVFFALTPGQVYALKASIGQPVLYPCDRCHPLGTKPIPSDFEGHNIKLQGHDSLGDGQAACVVCHQPGNQDPAFVKIIGGGTTNIIDQASVAKLCYRCHFDKYKEWEKDMHGKQPGCTTKGCHDPHTPGWVAISPLLPFLGTSIEVKIAPERESFKALPPPPPPPKVPSLPALNLVAGLGLLLVLIVVGLTAGPSIIRRLKR